MRSSAALAVWPSCFEHFSPATQAQRPGSRGAWIATTARWPGSLCRARLGIISVSFTLFPSFPGIVKAQRCADGANPCQNRQGRFREQHTGKNGIENPPDKVNVPGNLALSVHSCVGSRCHSSARFVQLCLTAGWLAAYGYQTDEFAVLVEGVFDTDRAVAGWIIRPPTNGGQPTNSAATSIVRACTGARPVAALLSGVLPRYAQASDNRSSVPARDTGSAKDSVPPP